MSNPQESVKHESVKARLQADLTTAMKARDEITTSTIRMVRSAITNAEVAGSTAIELTDQQVIGVLQSEAKKRVEAADVYEQAGRTASAAKERAELAVIERYLPAAMGDAELAALVDDAVRRGCGRWRGGPQGHGPGDRRCPRARWRGGRRGPDRRPREGPTRELNPTVRPVFTVATGPRAGTFSSRPYRRRDDGPGLRAGWAGGSG